MLACGKHEEPRTPAKAPPPATRTSLGDLPVETHTLMLAHTPGGTYTYTYAAPVGWHERIVDDASFTFAQYDHRERDDQSTFSISANPALTCEIAFGGFRDATWQILREGPANGRCSIAARTAPDGPGIPETQAVVYWVTGRVGHTCIAHLQGKTQAAWASFLAICSHVVGVGSP